jgi:hypothetical protein
MDDESRWFEAIPKRWDDLTKFPTQQTQRLSTLVELSHVALVRILCHGDICPVAVVAAIRAAVLVHVFVGGAAVASIVLRVCQILVIR